MSDDTPVAKVLVDAIALGRMARPEEIANVMAFLSGNGPSCATATTILADDGPIKSGPGP